MQFASIKLIENVVLIKWLGHEKGEVEHLFKVLPQFSRLGDTKDAIKGATLNRESISNIHIHLPHFAPV